jgi:hypothetical protein
MSADLARCFGIAQPSRGDAAGEEPAVPVALGRQDGSFPAHAVLAAHFPAAAASPDRLLLRFDASAWDDTAVLARAQSGLSASPALHAATGPLDPNGTRQTARQLTAGGGGRAAAWCTIGWGARWAEAWRRGCRWTGPARPT